MASPLHLSSSRVFSPSLEGVPFAVCAGSLFCWAGRCKGSPRLTWVNVAGRQPRAWFLEPLEGL